MTSAAPSSSLSPAGARRWRSRLFHTPGWLGVLLLLGLATTATGGANLDQDGQNPVLDRDLTTISLEQLADLKVISASLHEESLRDAPASVTVITAEDIRKFGYRTLRDALSYVRDFFASSDHSYASIGIRGFNLPGYETRFVLMVNGHSIAENLTDSTFAGNDFPVDLDLVQRIEVVRGPSSALYGSNGVLATINVVTKRPMDMRGTAVTVETDSLSGRKVGVSTAVALGQSANLLLSTSVFNNTGSHQLYFPEFDTAQTNFGRAIGMDGEKGYHVFADLTWGSWEVLAVAGDRIKVQPVSWGDTVFNDPGTRVEDSRAFVELSYTRNLSGDRTLSWRTSYDSYRYRGIYHYVIDGVDGLPSGIQDSREHDYGDWVASKLTYRFPDSSSGHLTLGAEFKVDVRALMNAFDIQPQKNQLLWIDLPDRYVGIFAQQEWALGHHWNLNLGGRFDWSWLKSSSVSPRVAVIYKPSPKSDIKVLYGRAFRNPSTYTMFYDDGGLSQIANPALRPETTDTYEVDFDRDFTRRWRASASVYHYRVNGLVQQIYGADGVIQNVNADRVRAAGASLELTCILPKAITLASSLQIQRAVFSSGAVLPNSPGQVGKLHLSAPLWRQTVNLSAGLQALGQRRTYAGANLPWVILPEAAISIRQLAGGLQLSAGIQNLSNSFYREPVGLSSTVDSMIGNGRTIYLKVSWNSAVKDDGASSNGQHPRGCCSSSQGGRK